VVLLSVLVVVFANGASTILHHWNPFDEPSTCGGG
jgi:hypothetical protein